MNLKSKIEADLIPLSFEHNGINYTGVAKPVGVNSNADEIYFEMDITLNGKHLGTMTCGSNLIWTLKGNTDQEFVNKIGNEIVLWYE